MTKVRLLTGMPDYADWSLFFAPEHRHYILNEASHVFEYKPYSDIRVKITGDSFTFDKQGNATGGTIGAVKVYQHGHPILKMTGVGQKLATFYKEAFGKHADAHDALAILLKGGSKFIGESGSEIMPAAPASGRDIVRSGDGNDVVNGDRADDRLDGGAGYDVLMYQPTYRQRDGSKETLAGINLDAALGKVSDPWGDHDTISNFEAYQATNFTDIMRGSSQADEFTGGKGNDVIDGRDGIDVIWYAAEAAFGGDGGIEANLATGRIKDAFGTIDTVSNIESVAGTMKRDGFVGDDRDNSFEGIAGEDSFNGGLGAHDVISFIQNERFGAKIGASVDLRIGQILNDGFGNIENASSIEDIRGSTLADRLTGDGNANHLVGEGGGDTIDGGAGDDILEGGLGIDTLSYASSGSGVKVSLALASAQDTGGAGTDRVSGFENLVGSPFDDVLTGDSKYNNIEAGNGNDTVFVSASDGEFGDSLSGGNGSDTISYANADGPVSLEFFPGNGFENLIGSAFSDILNGDDNANKLTGGREDRLFGGDGADVLDGGEGHDVLIGDHRFSAGDTFLFTAPIIAANSDTIGNEFDWFDQDDKIGLSKNVMNLTGNVGDQLSESEFTYGPNATTSDHRIITDLGGLYYDSDGTGPAPKVLIVQFSRGASIEADDIFLVA